jgi:hypothetical protein
MTLENLNTLSYNQLLDLYNQYGKSTFLKTLFSTNTPYNHTRLLEELSKLPDTQNSKLTTHNSQQNPTLNTQHSTLTTHNSQLNTLINRRRHLYRTAADAHSKLKAIYLNNSTESGAKKNDVTASLAFKILDVMDEIKPIWALTNHYDATNQLPDGITITPEGQINSTLNTHNATLTTQTDLALNTEFIKHYKYITRYSKTPSVAAQLAHRQSLCSAIKQELESRGTFMYPNHKFTKP